MSVKGITANLLLTLGSVLFFALMLELTLRFVYPIYEAAASPLYDRNAELVWAPPPNRVFERRHPDTGVAHPVIYNNIALRHNRDFETLSDATNIAFFGDSFTANVGLPSAHSFNEPLDYLLNRTGRRFNALNFGVNGYGTDQAYLAYATSEHRAQLHHVFYVACENDLRNIYENALFDLSENGELIRNPVPDPPLWAKLISRMHITYLALDLRQRVLYSREGDLEAYRAAMEGITLRSEHQERFHDDLATHIHLSFLQDRGDAELERTARIFNLILHAWRDAVEAEGGRFYIVLLPREIEDVAFKALIDDQEFRVISLWDRLSQSITNYDWRNLRFTVDGHWNEEGNRLAALHLYRVLEGELAVPPVAPEELERRLATYYSAFPGAWQPEAMPESGVPAETLEEIRRKYAALELIHSEARN